MTSADASDIPKVLARAVEATARGDYATALPIFAAVYQNVPREQFPQGLSSYGLCLSKVEHKNKLGAELCEKAIALQGYEGSHWANLVRLHIGVKNPKKAAEWLEKGLTRLPRDPALLRLCNEIDPKAAAPELRTLVRRATQSRRLPKRSIGKYSKIITIVIGGALYIALVIQVFRWVVNR